MSTRFVVDNSVVMSWCFEDKGNSYAEAILDEQWTALCLRLDIPVDKESLNEERQHVCATFLVW